jgi:hypothetical protein
MIKNIAATSHYTTFIGLTNRIDQVDGVVRIECTEEEALEIMAIGKTCIEGGLAAPNIVRSVMDDGLTQFPISKVKDELGKTTRIEIYHSKQGSHVYHGCMYRLQYVASAVHVNDEDGVQFDVVVVRI